MGLEIGEKRVLGEGRLSGGKGRKKKTLELLVSLGW